MAGVPTARVNLSKPAGVCTLRYKACGLVTTKRQLPGQKGDRSRCRSVRFATHLDAQFAVEHKEGLVIRQIPMHRTGIALLSLVFQDRQASGCGVPPVRTRTSAPRNDTACWTSGVRVAGVLIALALFSNVIS